MNQLGITSVIDATNIPSNPQYQGIEYLRTPLDDDVISNITQYFVKVADFVESTRSKSWNVGLNSGEEPLSALPFEMRAMNEYLKT
ncbi:unnamed protein product [Anisakis simplex]|uniref:Uncharacterized protein n=1 Tax=Anisakis simplex TaxID=6269 RepID=A0A3P6NX76_ANISI|nr:unnamed protein product [Anisakis simplex]